jgi:hypothetical protein
METTGNRFLDFAQSLLVFRLPGSLFDTIAWPSSMLYTFGSDTHWIVDDHAQQMCVAPM